MIRNEHKVVLIQINARTRGIVRVGWSKLDLHRLHFLADGYRALLRSTPPLKPFNVNTRSNLSDGSCRPRERLRPVQVVEKRKRKWRREEKNRVVQ